MGVPFRPIRPNPELDIHPDPPDDWDRVAVVTFWGDVPKARTRWPDAAVIGPLRGARGVDELARNLLANSQITHLICDGKDIGVGEAATRAIKRMFAGDTTVLALATQEVIRSSADAWDAWRELVRWVRCEPPPFSPYPHAFRGYAAVIDPPPVEVEERAPSGLPGDRIVAETVDQVWVRAMDRIMACGSTMPTQYGDTSELLDLVTVITNPAAYPKLISEHFPGMDEYYERLVKPHAPAEAAYTYGSRTFDQQEAVERLIESSPLTRAAHVTPWRPEDSGIESGRPCLVSVGWRALPGPEGHTLTLRVAFRSHDYWAGYSINLAAFARLLVETAARRKMLVGTLTCVSYSAHVYERDYDAARQLIAKHLDYRGIRTDARSTWVVSREAGEILAVAYTPDATRVIGVFRGRTAERVCARVEASGLLQEYGNALWLGGQLARAEAEG